MSCVKTENPKCPGVDSDCGAICDKCNDVMRRRAKQGINKHTKTRVDGKARRHGPRTLPANKKQ